MLMGAILRPPSHFHKKYRERLDKMQTAMHHANMQRTPRHELADLKLGGDGELALFVAERRADGKSWQKIARELWAVTGIDVTPESLRTWCGEPAPEQVGA